MGETVEKIYCCDRDNNDNALVASMYIGNVFAEEFKRICEYDSKQNIETFDFVTYPHDKNVIFNS